MLTLIICALAGGYGKTMTALACAAWCKALGLNVTLLDLDPQAAATLTLGMRASGSPLTDEACTVGFTRGIVGAHAFGSLRVFRSGRMLAEASAADVRRQLARASAGSDLLIVDTAPALSVATLEALRHASLALTTLRPTPAAIGTLGDTMQAMACVGDSKRLRGVLTQVNSRRKMVGTVSVEIQQLHPGVLYDVLIPDDAQCEHAALARLPVPVFAACSKASIAYGLLTMQLVHDLGLFGRIKQVSTIAEGANVAP